MQEKSATLYMTEGSSDKVYKLQLVASGGAWDVNFQNGRRGSALREGVKGSGLDYEAALKLYEKTLKSKISGGYTEDVSGAAFTATQFAGEVTGFKPQLLNPIEADAARALGMTGWWVQEKHDGERRGVLVQNGNVAFANRRGLRVGSAGEVSEVISALAMKVPNCTLDAEDLGAHLVIFDVISWPNMPEDAPFKLRIAAMEELRNMLLDLGVYDRVSVDMPIPIAEFFSKGHDERLRAEMAEGFVLRHERSVYTPGRPNAGGDVLKVKFWEDATCRVTRGRGDRRSVGLQMLSAGAWVDVGNVTVPENQDVPQEGTLVDVRYLYAYPGGSLFQPTFLGVRGDLSEEDCTVDRLKYKRA